MKEIRLVDHSYYPKEIEKKLRKMGFIDKSNNTPNIPRTEVTIFYNDNEDDQ